MESWLRKRLTQLQLFSIPLVSNIGTSTQYTLRKRFDKLISTHKQVYEPAQELGGSSS